MMAGIGSAGGSLVGGVAGWLLTYAVHSTILLGAAALATGRLVRADAWREVIWKAALLGGLVTATLQSGLGFRPLAGEWRLPADAVGAKAAAGLVDRAIDGRADGGRALVREAAAASDTRSTDAAPGAGPNLAARTERPDLAGAADGGPARTEAAEMASPAADATAGGTARNGDAPPAWLVALLALWSAGAAFLIARLGRRQLRLWRLLRDRGQVTDGAMLSLLAKLRRNAGVWRPVRLTMSAACPSPLALGTHEICVPEPFLSRLDPEQQRSALAHELAHLARRDPAWHLAAGVVESVFFFQPLNRLARRRLREAAENLCDDWAVRQTGSALELARCLAEVASWVVPGAEPVPSGTMAMAEGGSPLLRRVDRLLSERAGTAPRGVRLAAAGAAGLLALVAAVAPAVSATGVGAGREVVIPVASDTMSEVASSDGADASEADAPGDPLAESAAAAPPDAATGDPGVASLVDGEDGVGARTAAVAATEPAGVPAREPSPGRVQESVIRHPAPDEPLERRWVWAEAEAQRRGHSAYWVGYAFERMLQADRLYVHDSEGWSTDETDDGPLGRLVFGPAYDRPAKASGPVRQPVLVLFRVAGGTASPAVDRVSVRIASLGMRLRGLPLYWLGSAAEPESFDWLRRWVDELDGERLRGTVIEAIAMHEAAGRVVPFLEEVVRSDRPAEVREDAVEGLAWHPTDRSVALLRATALEDRSAAIREEAAETLGEMATPAASAALAEIVESRASEDVRGEAVEAMAGRRAPEVLETLLRVAFEDSNAGIQEEAVETIGEFPASAAVPALERIAREHPSIDIRGEAVERLGEMDPAAAADVLEALLREDAPAALREEALDALAERPSPRALEAVVAVAMSDPSPGLQEEAVEKLAEFAPADALPHLQRIIREHPRSSVRLEAIETLAEFPAQLALPVLDDIVAQSTDSAVLDEAIQAIAEFPSDLSVPRLLGILREHPREAARREALDQLGDRIG